MPTTVDPHYFTIILFEGMTPVAAVLKDDYTAYVDLENGIQGAQLTDVNFDEYDEKTFGKDLKEYLEQMREEYSVVYTNNPDAARLWMWKYQLQFMGTRKLDVPARGFFTKEYIQKHARKLLAIAQRDEAM